jgi:hypothetical protein
MKNLYRQIVALGLVLSFILVWGDSAQGQILRKRGKGTAPPPPPPVRVVPVPVVPVQPAQPVLPVVVEEEQQVQIAPAPAVQTTNVSAEAGSVHRISTFMNTPVHLTGGATSGQVADFILNDHGCVDYLVVSHNNRYMLVPFRVAQFNWSGRFIGLNINQDRFNQIPTFTQAQWGTVYGPQSQYMQQLNTFFGVNAGRVSTGLNTQTNTQTNGQDTTVNNPVTNNPGAQAPGTAAPGTATPGTPLPATNNPTLNNPGTTSPGPVAPAPNSQGRNTVNPPQPLVPSLPNNPASSNPTPGNTPGTPGSNPATTPANPGPVNPGSTIPGNTAPGNTPPGTTTPSTPRRGSSSPGRP